MRDIATFSISPLVELSLTIVKNLTCGLIYVALATLLAMSVCYRAIIDARSLH